MNELIDTNTLQEPTKPLLPGSRSYQQPSLKVYHADSLLKMPELESESVNCILTDPPYKYLKNQKLEVDFNEEIFFNEAKRILKKDGFIILFGRGVSFYRWNTILSDLGFVFKEEIVWDKCYCTSPMMAMSRVHETISIFTKKTGIINKLKVPYLEMKKYDIGSICQDINRLKQALNNPKSLIAVKDYLENNKLIFEEQEKFTKFSVTSDKRKKPDRCASVMNSIEIGQNEKSIIRTDFQVPTNLRTGVPVRDSLESGDRCVNVVNSMSTGMNEKTIIKESRDHYSAIHPTQKPVRLIERLLALTTKVGDIVVDPFAGSCSTGEACLNTKRNFMGYEIDNEYYSKAVERLKSVEPRLF